MQTTRKYLMCPPTYFDPNAWDINPWMTTTPSPDQAYDPQLAERQWLALVEQHQALGHGVRIMSPQAGLADQIFSANFALCIGQQAMLGRPRPHQRRPEIKFARSELERLGYTDIAIAPYDFSGQGDALPVGDDLIFMGMGWRTDPQMAKELATYFQRLVLPLSTIPDTLDPSNSRFYDLDLAVAVLGDNLIACCLEALTPTSRLLLEGLPGDQDIDIIEVSLAEALTGALNLISDGQNVMMPLANAPIFQASLVDRGFTVYGMEVSELWKGGGAVRCTSLDIHGAPIV